MGLAVTLGLGLGVRLGLGLGVRLGLGLGVRLGLGLVRVWFRIGFRSMVRVKVKFRA